MINQENDLQEPQNLQEKQLLQDEPPPLTATMISSPPPKPPPKPPSRQLDSPSDSSYGYVFSPPQVKQATYQCPPQDHISHTYVFSSPDVKPAKPPSPPSAPESTPTPPIKTHSEEVVKPAADVFVGGGIRGGKKISIPERMRDNLNIRALLGFRIFGFVFCLVSFSIMVADKNQGWALDSFYRYKEFRYCMSVNVMGFVYLGLQSYDLAYSLATGKFVARNKLRIYLDFSLDQLLTYLLLSASTSAAFRVEDWESNWGKDKFPAMARSSVVLSFLASVAFALSSLISGHTVFTSKSM